MDHRHGLSLSADCRKIGKTNNFGDRPMTIDMHAHWSPHQWIERLPVAESLPAVQVFNNATSAVCAENPGRFVGCRVRGL